MRQDFMAWRSDVARNSGDREADTGFGHFGHALLGPGERNDFQQPRCRVPPVYIVLTGPNDLAPEHIEAFMRVAPIELQTCAHSCNSYGPASGRFVAAELE